MSKFAFQRAPLSHAIALAVALSAGAAVAQQPSTTSATSAKPSEEEVARLDAVSVTGVRAAAISARAAERATNVISNVVTSDDAGQFSDQNVGESLQRIPGISLDRDAGEGRRISVRGLGAQFNPVTINGVTLATSELDRDASVDILPNDLLGVLTVTKTLTPDMNADAIGAAVDLRAIDPYERENGGLIRLEGGRQQYAGEIDPKFSGALNQLVALADGGKFGYSLAASYSRRNLEGDSQRNRDIPLATTLNGVSTLRSVRVENRHDLSERTRKGLAANFDWAPNANHSLYARFIGASFDVVDERYVDRWQMGPTRAIALGPGTGTFQGGTDVELRKQITFTERNEDTTLVQLGGSSTLDSWKFDYSLAGSRNRQKVPELLTGRFRVRNIVVDYTQSADQILISGRQRTGGTFPDPAVATNYVYDQLTLQSENREDEVRQANFDLTRDFSWGDRSGYFKAGVKGHRRDKFADREEFNPATLPTSNLGLLALQTIDTQVPGFGGLFPQADPARQLFLSSLVGLAQATNNNSVNADYNVSEDVDAAYVMGSLDVTPVLTLFGGVRMEATDWNTGGFAIDTVDPIVGANVTSVRTLSNVRNDYSDLLPSLHLRWEPSADVVVRASASSAIVRPNFDEGSATTIISTNEITAAPGTYRRTYSGGNPALDPLVAKQFDLSVAWYPDPATVLYGGFFYKKIDDFYVQGTLVGSDVARAGLPVGNGTINGGFDAASVFINGDSATVRGVELFYEQAFIDLPGWWSGLFVSANLTLVDSEAKYTEVFNNRIGPLPDQADRIANLSLGWENEHFTFRVAGNYRDDQLDIINANPVLDQVLTAFYSWDVNLRWNLNEQMQIYFDGTNLNNEKDLTVWRGDASSGGPFPADEGGSIDFGRSYGLGFRYQF